MTAAAQRNHPGRGSARQSLFAARATISWLSSSGTRNSSGGNART
jgi:hypothetical protein